MKFEIDRKLLNSWKAKYIRFSDNDYHLTDNECKDCFSLALIKDTISTIPKNVKTVVLYYDAGMLKISYHNTTISQREVYSCY